MPLSCVICAYNEGSRISQVLKVAARHCLLGEVIVVNDGSQDDTAARAAEFQGVQLLTNDRNRGKSWTLARGISAARFDQIMLLDADLVGLRASDLDALAAPVLNGAADVTLSLRGDSLYRAVGIDFVSGERVLPRSLFRNVLEALSNKPSWGAEVFINELILARALRLAVVDWKAVTYTPKRSKRGALRGVLSELGMTRDIVYELRPTGLLMQNLALLSAARRTGKGRLQRAPANEWN